MPKHLGFKIAIIATLASALGTPFAYGIDPFTIAAVVNTAASAISTVSEATGEVAASADAFGELYSEIDSEAEVSGGGQKLIREIREIEAIANEIGYTKADLEQLSTDATDPANAQKLSNVLHTITKAVRAGKRVARLAMKLDQKAKIAQFESAQLQREQLIAMMKEIERQHEKDLKAVKEKLLELKDKRDQIATLRGEEAKHGAKIFGKTGVLSFPTQESVVEEALKIAVGLRPSLLAMVMFIFFARLIANQFGMFEVARYGTLIRDTVICTLLLAVFPDLVRSVVTLSHNLANSIGMGQMSDVQSGKLDFPSTIGFSIKPRIFLEWLYDWIKYIVFVAALFLTNFGLALLIVVFPIVIFCSQMLNFTVAWPIFLASLIALSLWPLFWNATGLLASSLWQKNQASFSDQCTTVLLSLLQFFSPFIGMAALKGQPIAKAVGGAAEALKAKATGGASLAWNAAKAGLHGSTGNSDGLDAMKPSAGKHMGRVLSYLPNQLASRSVAAATRSASAIKTQLAASTNSNHRMTQGVSLWRSAAKEGLKGFVSNHTQAQAQGGKSSLASAGRALKGLKRTEVFRPAPNAAQGKG